MPSALHVGTEPSPATKRAGQFLVVVEPDSGQAPRRGRVVLDAGCRVGHIATVTVWPGADGRPWLEPLGAGGARIPVPDLLSP